MVMDSTGMVDDKSGRAQPGWPVLLGFGLATRVIVVVLGCVLAHPAGRVAQAPGGHRWIEPWYRWDGNWYAEIAERGYSYRPGSESSVAFLPMLPLLMRAGGRPGTGPPLGGPHHRPTWRSRSGWPCSADAHPG